MPQELLLNQRVLTTMKSEALNARAGIIVAVLPKGKYRVLLSERKRLKYKTDLETEVELTIKNLKTCLTVLLLVVLFSSGCSTTKFKYKHTFSRSERQSERALPSKFKE